MSNKTIQGVAVPRFDSVFKLKPLSQRLLLAHAAVLGAVICAPLQADAATEQEAAQLAPMVITGVAQQSPITVVTDPRIPRQPVPASDAADYLKRFQVSLPFVAVALTVIQCFAGCLVRALNCSPMAARCLVRVQAGWIRPAPISALKPTIS